MNTRATQIMTGLIPEGDKPQKSQQAFLSDKGVAARYDVSRATIWRWAAEGRIPKPVKIVGSTRWRLADIQAWEKSQGVAQ